VSNGTRLPRPNTKQQWLKDTLPGDAAKPHLRLVFSFSGYSEDEIKNVNEYNARNPEWAVLLCQSSPDFIGAVDASARKVLPDQSHARKIDSIDHIAPGFCFAD